MFKVLTINTYAGSLLLAAKAARLPVAASLEDVGYGVEVQRWNFPSLTILPTLDLWSTFKALEDKIVIAHPPCSAFSQQNSKANTKGVGSEAFACTRRALDFALGGGAPAVAVESVVGALRGAWEVHDEYARRFPYRLYRILQNAETFGVPQHRPRFWVVYLHKDFKKPWVVRHVPKFKLVKDVAFGGENSVLTFPSIQSGFERQLLKFYRGGVPRHRINAILAGKHGYGSFFAIYKRVYAQDKSLQWLNQEYAPGEFFSKIVRILDPSRPATAVLGDAVWVHEGQLLTKGDYQEIAGFPRGYDFPQKALSRAPFYLSQGIAPPVGAWLLKELVTYLRRPRVASNPWDRTAEPGEVLDLNHPGALEAYRQDRFAQL